MLCYYLIIELVFPVGIQELINNTSSLAGDILTSIHIHMNNLFRSICLQAC